MRLALASKGYRPVMALYPGRAVAGVALLPMLRRAAESEGAWLRAVDTLAERDALIATLSEEPPRGVADPRYLPVLLGTHHDEQSARLQAGEALERLVLTSAALGHDALVQAPVAVNPGPGVIALTVERGLTPQALVLIARNPR